MKKKIANMILNVINWYPTSDDDDGTIMTKLTKESSLDYKEIEHDLIDDEDDKYDNNIVIIPTQNYSEWNRIRTGNPSGNPKWQKEKYSRKVKMKKKIANMILNVTNGYPKGDNDVSREYGTNRILKMIDRQKLSKKKRMPNQWPDHPT